jgi:hypothetical protein
VRGRYGERGREAHQCDVSVSLLEPCSCKLTLDPKLVSWALCSNELDSEMVDNPLESHLALVWLTFAGLLQLLNNSPSVVSGGSSGRSGTWVSAVVVVVVIAVVD